MVKNSSSFLVASLVLRILSLLLFAALWGVGPLREATLMDRSFSSTLLVGTAAILMFSTRRMAFSLMLTTAFYGLILLSSYLKFQYLTAPLMAPDLVYFVNKDLLDLFFHYPALLSTTIVVLIMVPITLFLAWRYDRPMTFPRWPHRTKQLIRYTGIFISFLVLSACAIPQGPFSAVYEKGMWVTIIDKSFISNFFTSFSKTQIIIPESPPNVDRTISWGETNSSKNSEGCSDSSSCSSSTEPRRYPDIVAVLEESTFDPRILEICTLPVCKRSMFVPDRRTQASGYLNVHTWGGGTWTSEFALLTGLNNYTFGEAGLYAPYNLAPRVNYSLPKLLKSAGYRIVTLYPMSGNFINARNAYENYGFDAFYQATDYGLQWESPDQELFEIFNKVYEKEKKIAGDQPLFIFMLTLRQHGPHMKPLKTLPAPYNQPLFPQLSDWLNLNLSNYLYRLEQSDIAMAALEKKLLQRDQSTVLLHFGDHQPSFDGAIANLKKNVPSQIKNSRYVTYYMLKTNFILPKEYDYPVLDISFLGGLLIEVADVTQDKFFQANSLMRERCKGIYLDCPQKEILASYHDYIFHQITALRE